MKEFFLHSVWQQGSFNPINLVTTNGEKVSIKNRGLLNRDSGPDFFNAKIQLGNRTWVGNVEIHVKASEWNAHNHQHDSTYDNTILHVVWECDADVFTKSGVMVPCIELKRWIQPGMYDHYDNLIQSLQAIPCASHRPAFQLADTQKILMMALLERLQKKSTRIQSIAAETRNDWQSVFYMLVSRYLGFRINADAMETLARITPQQLLAKYKTDLFQLEALLFGQSQLLQVGMGDAYPKGLWKEYQYLKAKHGLSPMLPSSWKFMRMRPANFPTIRIAQLAGLAFKSVHLFSEILETSSIKAVRGFFDVTASGYWNDHYRFDHQSICRPKPLGNSAAEGLITNAVVPMLFAYGEHTQRKDLQDRAMEFLSLQKPEDNRILREWQGLGFANASALESQALMGLQEQFCNLRRCMECEIGMRIISE